MGQGTSAIPRATDEMQDWVRSNINHWTPQTLSVVNATERARPLQSREMALSATFHLMNPRAVDWGLIGGAIRNGWVDKLRILFDAKEMQYFGPKIESILSYCDKIQTLECFADQLPRSTYLTFFTYPNVLDALPRTCPALTSFYLATHHCQQVHFDVVARVLLRAPNLKTLKLEGPLLALGQERYEDFIPCQLETLILMYVDLKLPVLEDILCRSATSLKNLHVEHVTNLEMMGLAQIIGRMLRNLRRLTIIVPDAVALQVSNVELAHLLDKASAQPLLTIEYLYCSGLAISDETLTRESNSIGIIKSPLPALQSLYLHDCRRLTMEALITAIWYKRLPSLIQLEAIWPLEHLKEGEYNVLAKACAERNIQMTSEMSAHYAPIFQAEVESKLQARQVLDNDARNIAKQLGAASPSTFYDRTPAMSTTSSRSSRSKKSTRSGHSSHKSFRKHDKKGKKSRHSRQASDSTSDSCSVSGSDSGSDTATDASDSGSESESGSGSDDSDTRRRRRSRGSKHKHSPRHSHKSKHKRR